MAAAYSDANTTSSTCIASDNCVLTAAAGYAATESTSYAEDDRVLSSKPLGLHPKTPKPQNPFQGHQL